MEGIKKPPLFQRENSDPIAQHAVRMVSVDSASLQAKKSTSFKRKKSNRSLSAGEQPSQFMSPLSFENIDVVSTPLSSLRSCSEYQRINSNRNDKKNDQPTNAKKGFWSRFSLFSKNSQPPKNKLKVRFAEEEEETSFLVEKLRFNQANLMEGEDYNYSSTNISESAPTSRLDSPRKSAIRPSFSRQTQKKSSNSSSFFSSSSRASIVHESSMAFDYLFGIHALSKSSMPMEIELKNFKEPQILTTISSNEEHAELSEVESIRERESIGGLQLRRVNSHRSFASLDRLSIDVPTDVYYSAPNTPMELPTPAAFQLNRTETWRPVAAGYWQACMDRLRAKFPPSRGDDLFYESIRIQPFSSGAYLRGMLLAGMSSMVFQIYNCITWSSVATTTTPTLLVSMLYLNLLFQIGLNALQFPFRLRIHFLCWEASRAVEVDAAIHTIRTMLQGDSWLVNRLLGRAIDLLSLLSFVLTEIYLYSTDSQDPLRNVVISLCATNLLTLVSRVVVATIFSLSMHDPHVLSEARRRGLSKCDLDVLPTFVFTTIDEVNNEDCSICLSNFEMGEMLTCLPCDKKHSFHSNCIRQWLERQNSCPLCQKLV